MMMMMMVMLMMVHNGNLFIFWNMLQIVQEGSQDSMEPFNSSYLYSETNLLKLLLQYHHLSCPQLTTSGWGT